MVIRFLLDFYLYTFITILMYYNICVYYYRWFQRQSGDHVGYRSTRLQRLLNNVEVRGDKVKIQLNLQTIHIYIPIYLTQFSYISLFNMTLTFLCINDLETTTFLMTFTSLFFSRLAVMNLPKTDSITIVYQPDLDLLVAGCERSCYAWKIDKVKRSKEKHV